MLSSTCTYSTLEHLLPYYYYWTTDVHVEVNLFYNPVHFTLKSQPTTKVNLTIKPTFCIVKQVDERFYWMDYTAAWLWYRILVQLSVANW